ncbi:hypothetical protein [Chryseobacterium proteolyticum]|uniref:hypothetical protein n=1 Tax=Chryseobacterium proteolyticum TaxID=118127 RepID=UPI0039833B6D
MKKFFYSTIVILSFFLIVSCENDNIASTSNQPGKVEQRAEAKNSEISLKVSEQGFLIFDNKESVNLYIDFLQNNDMDAIKDVFTTYNFNPLNINDFDKDQNPQFYTFNNNGLVQIGNSVFKLSDDRLYLTSISQSQLSIDNYNLLVSGGFNQQLMNMFSLFKDRGGVSYNIIDIADATPSGINEQNDPPSSTAAKFWGKIEYRGPCEAGSGTRWVRVVTYVLWQEVWESGYFEPC